MIIDRKSAIANNLPRYFTGRSCKRGHVAERYTSSGVCVLCQHAKTSEWRSKNRDAIKQYNAAWRSRNPIYSGDWYRKNIFRERERSRLNAAERRRKDPASVREYNKAWRRANALHARRYDQMYAEQNRAARNERQSRRRVRQASQKCDCCSREEILSIYEVARERGMEVDHIVPLAIGGLHCAKNLQALSPQCHREKTSSDIAKIAAHRQKQKVAS